MKELLAKQGLNKENSHNGSHPNGQAWNGNANDQQGNQRGQGRHNASGQGHQGNGHMAKECQNPSAPQGVGQKAPVPPVQGRNTYAQNFVQMQYPVSTQQPVVLQHVPQYVQSDMAPVQQTRLPTVTISQVGQGTSYSTSSTATINLIRIVPRAKEQPRVVYLLMTQKCPRN